MTEKNQSASLFPDFSPVPATEWAARIAKDLKGESPDSLLTSTYEGITIKPFYTTDAISAMPQAATLPGKFPYVRGHKTETNRWHNLQDITVTGNGHAAIDKAAQAIQAGANGIHFKIEDETAFDLDYLVSRLAVTQITLGLSVPRRAPKFLEQLYAVIKKHRLSPHGLKGFINVYQPVAQETVNPVFDVLEQLLEQTKGAPDFRGITINGAQFGNNGATAVQEIAFTISAAVCYMDGLSKRGIPLAPIFRNMQFWVSVGTNYFFEIAKFRALRWLWAGVVKATEEKPDLAAYLRIHASSSSWVATTFEPHTNILRTTTEAMAAIIGGCDSLALLPFDVTFAAENPFSERIARNIPLILQHEAYLDQAIDPAAGSYYLESLTQELAQESWKLFQELEKQGGFAPAVQNNTIQRMLTQSAQEKFRNIAAGQQVFVGSNKFANRHEKLDFNAEELIQSKQFDNTRACYPFEVMRLAAMLHYTKQNARPKAVIAIIGHDIQEHIHAAFAKEFFECGDFDTEIIHFDSVQASLEKLLFTQCKAIVLSATESEFARFSDHFTQALRQHKQRPVLILAASPEEMREELQENGFDDYIFQNCNAASIIGRIQERLLNSEV